MLQLLCSHLTPDKSTLRVIGPALNLCKHSGRRMGTLWTWIDLGRKHMRRARCAMSQLGYITLLRNICRPRAALKRMWRRPSDNLIPPCGTSLHGHLGERHQPGLSSSARWEFQGVVPWLLRWKPSQATGRNQRVIPMQVGQHVDLFPLWCQASERAVGMRGWTFPCLELCFPVLWLFESVTGQ